MISVVSLDECFPTPRGIRVRSVHLNTELAPHRELKMMIPAPFIGFQYMDGE